MYVDYMHHCPSDCSAVGIVGCPFRQRKGTKKKKEIKMATITYTFNGKSNSLGTAQKDSLTYEMHETATEWKLMNSDSVLKAEWKWSKKDYATFEDWCIALKDSGFNIIK